MTQIAFPVYARTESRDELRRLHERAARVHAVVIFPALALLIALAPVVVPLVFGAAWKPAAAPTQILAVAGMAAAILTGYPQVMLAIGRPRALLRFNLAMLVIYGAAVLAASRHGLIVVAGAVTVAYLVILAGVYRFLLQRYLGIAVARLVPELGPALAGCLGLLAVSYPLTQLLAAALPRPATVAIAGGAGLLTYAALLAVAFPAAWCDLWTVVARVFPPASRITGWPRVTATFRAGVERG